MRGLVILVLCLVVFKGVSCSPQRIVGGDLTTISKYPSIAALLRSSNLHTYVQACAGTILTPRSILTAAHCTASWQPINWLARVGSTYAHSGGVIHLIDTIISHPDYNHWTIDNDITIIRTASAITYVNDAVQFAWLAGSHYILYDNEEVWAAGWGTTTYGGQPSETLRDVQVWTVNQETCRNNYAGIRLVTNNMLCSGYLGVGGRDQCHGDSGGPLYHNGIVIGICSWGLECALPYYPGVNTRISRYTAWIQSNA